MGWLYTAAVNKNVRADAWDVISQPLIRNHAFTIIFHVGRCSVNHLPASVFYTVADVENERMTTETWSVLFWIVRTDKLIWYRRNNTIWCPEIPTFFKKKRNKKTWRSHRIQDLRRKFCKITHTAFSEWTWLEIAPNFLCKYHWLQRQISLSLCVLFPHCSVGAIPSRWLLLFDIKLMRFPFSKHILSLPSLKEDSIYVYTLEWYLFCIFT